MKKKNELIGKDELNLVEVPFTLLTKEIRNESKTLEFIDKQNTIIRRWKIVGSIDFGLPCALDESVYIALLALSKKDGFNNSKIYFNQYQLLKIMNWPINGKYYKRLYLALNRLTGVTIFTNYLWDNGKFHEYKKAGFHIINEFVIDIGKKNTNSSYFEWNNILFNSFIAGNIKSLHIDTYFKLKTPTSRRFYRLYDKRLYKKDQLTFDLLELCHEKLGISRAIQSPSSLKRALNPTLKEHQEKELLSSVEYRINKDKKWALVIKKQDLPHTLDRLH